MVHVSPELGSVRVKVWSPFLSFFTRLSVIISNGRPSRILYAGRVKIWTCRYTNIGPQVNGTFLANPRVHSKVLFALSMSIVILASQVISNCLATSSAIEIICDPESNKDSTSPTLLIVG